MGGGITSNHSWYRDAYILRITTACFQFYEYSETSLIRSLTERGKVIGDHIKEG